MGRDWRADDREPGASRACERAFHVDRLQERYRGWRLLCAGLDFPHHTHTFLRQDGSIGIAIDAMHAAASGHTFLSVTKQGLSAIVETNGNPSTHVILRGSSKGPNFAAADVKACADKLVKAGLPGRLMVRRVA